MSTQISAAQARALTTPFNEGHRLHPDAARAWERAVKKFGKGVLLTDSYRPVSVQKRIFLERYVRGNHRGKTGFTNDVRWYDGSYWTRRRGVAAAAVPGTSNHGTGRAVDVRTRRGAGDPPYEKAVVFTSFNDADRLAFLRAAEQFGWDDDEGRSVDELWHLTYYPERDKWRGKAYPPKPKQAAKLDSALITSWQKALKTPADGVISRPRSSLIAAHQKAINSANKEGKFLSGAPLKVDGSLGPRTLVATVKYLNWLDRRKPLFSGAPLSTGKDAGSARMYYVLKLALKAGRITPRGY